MMTTKEIKMNKNYETEVRERWEDTLAYREYEQKTSNYTKERMAEATDGLMAIFAEFAACKQNAQRLILTKHRRL